MSNIEKRKRNDIFGQSRITSKLKTAEGYVFINHENANSIKEQDKVSMPPISRREVRRQDTNNLVNKSLKNPLLENKPRSPPMLDGTEPQHFSSFV